MELSGRIEAALPAPLLAACRLMGESAATREEGLYLVGGGVRDLILGRPFRELDLVLVGDVPRLAHEVETAALGRQVATSQFLTVRLDIAGHGVDLVTARRESYDRPGALPAIEAADLDADLRRRDFSINALAASLAPESFGEVIDVCGGLPDLEAGTLRALHSASFRDDATRILRGARYAARLGFRPEAETEEWLRRDAPYLEAISPDRLRHELDRIHQEEEPETVWGLLADWGALPHIHPGLHWDTALTEAFSRARTETPSDISLSSVYGVLLVGRMAPTVARGFVARLNLPAALASAIRDAARFRSEAEEMPDPSSLRPSALAERLDAYDPAALMAHALLPTWEPWSSVLHHYITSWRRLRPTLSGDDLLALGVQQGPSVGAYLRGLRAARLDGEVSSEEDERALVERWLRATPGPSPHG